jgi:hypothetical protein
VTRVLERRCEPIWYALAQAPVLTSMQWRAAVGHACDSMGDGELLLRLFERADRSEDDRLWLLDTIPQFQLDDLLRSPATTIVHARRALARCGKKPRTTRGAGHDSDLDRVASGLSWNPRLGDDVVLLEFTVGLVEQLSADEVVGIIVRWPGHQPAESLLWALLGRVVHLPEPYRNSWDKEADEPVGGQFAHLWKLLLVLPAEVQVQAAGRWPRLQAVLLEHGDGLAPVVLQACVPVLSDPNLGASGPVSVAGRLATLRRWSDRHRGLGESAAAACRTAGRDAARALRDPKLWEDLVDEMVLFTTDPQILTAAVEQIVSVVEVFGGVRETVETYHGPDDVERLGRRALLSLARSPHTPDDVLLQVLPSAPGHFAQDLLELRPHLSEPLRLEILARTGVLSYPRDRFEDPIVVPDDDELAATGNPDGVLTGLLMRLPTAGRAQAARLAAGLLHSRYADATVLAALPAEVVRQSPWHADLAAQMLAEACGDDSARWALASRVLVNRVTYGGYLAELREYTPMRPGQGLAGYRFCHACQLIGPHRWPETDKEQRMVHERDGWMTCGLCGRNVPPARLMTADTVQLCSDCATTIDYPAGAAVLQCPSCERCYAAPDLPEDLRPRLAGVLGEQRRTSDQIDALRTRLDEFLGERDSAGERDGPGGGGLGQLGPDGTPTVRRARPSRKFPGMFELTPPPAEWISDDLPARQFRTALRTALRRYDNPASRDAVLQRYGLGGTRRPVPAADIARAAGVTTATVTRWIRDAVGTVSAGACMPIYPQMRAGDRASLIAAHLADQALGNLDPADPATCRQIADLLTAALPGVDLDAGVRLLLHLAGCDTTLTPAAIHDLIRSVRQSA